MFVISDMIESNYLKILFYAKFILTNEVSLQTTIRLRRAVGSNHMQVLTARTT